MPTYKYTCDNGHTTVEHRGVKDRDVPAGCTECPLDARRDMLSEQKQGHTFDEYYDKHLDGGTHITSKRQKKQLKKKEGVKEKYGYE